MGGGVFLNKNILSKTKRGLVVGILLCSGIGNVRAITTNEVTYNNNGVEENLTETLDTLYTELKRYKTGGNVTPSEMLEGSSGYSKGVLVTGSIKKKEATTYTPGVNNITINQGQYLNGNQVIKGDTNLKPENIKSGVSIFGINGTYTSDANASSGAILSGYSAYVNGSKVEGSLKNLYTSATITHSVDNLEKVIPVDTMYLSTNSDGVGRLELQYKGEPGYIIPWTLFGIDYDRVKSFLEITEDKIVKGQQVGGVNGIAPKVTTFSINYFTDNYDFHFDNHKSAFSYRVSIRDQYPNYRNISRDNIYIDISNFRIIVYSSTKANYYGGNLTTSYDNTTGEIVLTGAYGGAEDVEYGVSLHPNEFVGIKVAIIE